MATSVLVTRLIVPFVVALWGGVVLYFELQSIGTPLRIKVSTKLSNITKSPDVNITITKPSINININHQYQQQRWTMKEFPYKTLGSGTDMKCEWKTNGIIGNDTKKYDWVQRTAYKEGTCVPEHLRETLHVFSSAEAIECLSTKRLVMSGDSYMLQMFFGVADILLSKAVRDDKEFGGRIERQEALHIVQGVLTRRREKDPSFPNLQFAGYRTAECYGSLAPFSEMCSKLINTYTEGNENTVAVVGAFVHIIEREKAVNSTLEEIKKFLSLAKNTVWVSNVSYQVEKVPRQYQKKMGDNKFVVGYDSLLQNVAPKDNQHPYLDVWQMTSSCDMENCSHDGHHRSRFVNRWKAQLLLNTICESAVNAANTLR